MPSEDDTGTGLAPEAAFSALGAETRLSILRALADADGPLSLSRLREPVGGRDSGRFKPGGGILSGGPTTAPSSGRPAGGWSRRWSSRPVSRSSARCGGPTLVSSVEWRVEHDCTECPGYYRRASPGEGEEHDHLGSVDLSPAGTEGRTPEALLRAAFTWGPVKLPVV